MTRPDPGHDRFDQAARAAHAQALEHVSAATMSRLHRRRHEALAHSPRARWQLPVAAFASLLVVSIGLGVGLRMADPPGAPAAPPLAAVATEPGIEAVLDDLDQTPDFYVWLASGDADLIAME